MLYFVETTIAGRRAGPVREYTDADTAAAALRRIMCHLRRGHTDALVRLEVAAPAGADGPPRVRGLATYRAAFDPAARRAGRRPMTAAAAWRDAAIAERGRAAGDARAITGPGGGLAARLGASLDAVLICISTAALTFLALGLVGG